MSDSVRPYGLLSRQLFCPWDSPGKNTGVGYHAFLQGNLSDPRIKPHLLDVNLHWQVGSLPLAPPGCVCRYICIYTCTYIYFYIHKKKSGRIHQKMLRITTTEMCRNQKGKVVFYLYPSVPVVLSTTYPL